MLARTLLYGNRQMGFSRGMGNTRESAIIRANIEHLPRRYLLQYVNRAVFDP
jgi:hypothetical protein